MIRVGTGILEYSFGPQISCLQPAAGHVRASVFFRFLTGLQRLPLRGVCCYSVDISYFSADAWPNAFRDLQPDAVLTEHL